MRSPAAGIFVDPKQGLMIRFEDRRERKATDAERATMLAALRAPLSGVPAEGEGRRLLMMAVALTIANYFYQGVGPHDWDTALDRSFFQSATLFYVWLALKFESSQLTPPTPGAA